MAHFEWQIGHELLVYRNYSSDVSNLTFWDVQTSTIFDSIQAREGSLREFWVSSPRNRPKVNEAPCRYVNIVLMQSNMSPLTKISKSCFKVIQRTLRSGKNWRRYSSFSAISRVKWPNLHAWPNFRALEHSPTHTGKTRQGVQRKSNTLKSETAWLSFLSFLGFEDPT